MLICQIVLFLDLAPLKISHFNLHSRTTKIKYQKKNKIKEWFIIHHDHQQYWSLIIRINFQYTSLKYARYIIYIFFGINHIFQCKQYFTKSLIYIYNVNIIILTKYYIRTQNQSEEHICSSPCSCSCRYGQKMWRKKQFQFCVV